jgi:hypothetical protein
MTNALWSVVSTLLLLPVTSWAFCAIRAPVPSLLFTRCDNVLRPVRTACPLVSGSLGRVSVERAAESENTSQREMVAVIVPDGQVLLPGETKTMMFSDKSEKRALKQVMKGGAFGKDGKVGRIALVHFDVAALAARRMELASTGIAAQVVCTTTCSTGGVLLDTIR